MIARLHHAQITVPRDAVEEARRFYCRVLGLREIPKPPSLAGRGGLWVQVGDQEVHISPEDGVDRAATKAHLAYQVTNLEAMRQLLAHEGITPGESVPIPGCDRFEFRDPWGNRVEFLQPVE